MPLIFDPTSPAFVRAVRRQVLQAFSIFSTFALIYYRPCPSSPSETLDEICATEKRRALASRLMTSSNCQKERFAIANEFRHRQPSEMLTTLRRREGEETLQCLRACG
jgi:hypothetical protein